MRWKHINMLNILRVVGYLEGISFLVLLFVAMPMKYVLNDASLIPMSGMAHGVLFMLYLVVLFVASHQQKWPVSTFLMGLVASILPFGPFVFDAKVIKQSQAQPT
ncbi:integral membrane protein [Vitreoscilla sp. C1]|nr:integral membrane protein [Vitreoscilla sp. C1]